MVCPDCRTVSCSRHLVACPACDSMRDGACSACRGTGEVTAGQALELKVDELRCSILMLNADKKMLQVEVFALRRLLADLGVTDLERAAAVASAIRKAA